MYMKHCKDEQDMRRDSWNKNHSYRLSQHLTEWKKFYYVMQHFQNEVLQRTTKLILFLFFTLMHYSIAAKIETRSAGKVAAGYLYLWLELFLAEKRSFSCVRLLSVHAEVWIKVWVKMHSNMFGFNYKFILIYLKPNILKQYCFKICLNSKW